VKDQGWDEICLLQGDQELDSDHADLSQLLRAQSRL
jgi:hypothetical protein